MRSKNHKKYDPFRVEQILAGLVHRRIIFYLLDVCNNGT